MNVAGVFRSIVAGLTCACVFAAGGCGMPRPITVGVAFQTQWKAGDEMLSDRDRSTIKLAAFQTLRDAFAAYQVEFVEGSSGDRLIKIEDTPFASYTRGSFVAPAGAVGVTYPVATVSSVRVDALYEAELAVTGCRRFRSCDAMSPEQFLEGFGRGIGATAAHELGHQAGLHFSRDALCGDCFDSHRATTYEHFFGMKHWSADAVTTMRRVLAPRPAGG
jgi:hypothetical protein